MISSNLIIFYIIIIKSSVLWLYKLNVGCMAKVHCIWMICLYISMLVYVLLSHLHIVLDLNIVNVLNLLVRHKNVLLKGLGI